MYAFRLNKAWIQDVLGLGSGHADETQAETINVRLEEMFREAVTDLAMIVLVHRDDLHKMLSYSPAWQQGGKIMRVPNITVISEEGFSDRQFRDLNIAPATLARQLAMSKRLVFCHAPVLQYRRIERGWELCVAMNVVQAPSTGEENCNALQVQPGPAEVPEHVDGPRRRARGRYEHDEAVGGDRSFGDFVGRRDTPAADELYRFADEPGPEGP